MESIESIHLRLSQQAHEIYLFRLRGLLLVDLFSYVL